MNSKIFFTSDLHFDHRNVIQYDNRPWSTVEEMNNSLIKNINDTVKCPDSLYILGDITLHSKTKRIVELMDQIRCKNVFLIKGNHDNLKPEAKEKFVWVKDYFKLKYFDESTKTKYKFILCHYPMCSWDGKETGVIHLHGHTHIEGHTSCSHPSKINVGIMIPEYNYKPVSIEQIIQRVVTKNYIHVMEDEHGIEYEVVRNWR